MFDLMGPIDPTQVSKVEWAEVTAYSEATGELPEVWERKAVRTMAEHYLRSAREAKNPLCIPPIKRT